MVLQAEGFGGLMVWVCTSLICMFCLPKQDCTYQVHVDIIIPFLQILSRGDLGLSYTAFIGHKITVTNNVLFLLYVTFKSSLL